MFFTITIEDPNTMNKKIYQFCALLLLTMSTLYAQDAKVLKMTQYCEIADNKLTETDTITFVIFNRNGEEHAQISIPYSKLEKLSDFEGWIDDIHGNKIRNLRSADITDVSYRDASTLYQDEFIKTLTLKHNVYPYMVTYTFRTTKKQFLSIAEWTPVYNYSIPTDKATLTVKTPINYQILFKESNILSHKTDSLSGQIRHTWTATYLQPIPSEKYSIDREELRPYVKVVPGRFIYGVEGELQSWESFGNWYWHLTKGLNDLSAQDKAQVQELTQGITDKKEMVRRIYHFMQDQTRYINISFNIGGFKPYPASYVSANKYGDCKALSNYMKSLLEVVGIPSYLTIIEGDHFPKKILKDFPSSQFNHVILTVPLDKDTLFLENTSNIHPFDFTGPFIQNREALLISDKKSALIHLPALSNKRTENDRTINIRLSKTGNADAELSFRFRGYNFDLFNSLKSDYNQDFQDRQVREYLPLSNYEVINWNLTKADRDSAFITLTAKANLYKFIKPIGNEFYFSILPVGSFGFETPDNRKLSVNLPFPIIYNDTINYIFPEGYKLKNLPDNQLIQTKFGKCNFLFLDKKDALTLIREFELNSGIIEKNEYNTFYAFLNRIAESDRKNIVITTE